VITTAAAEPAVGVQIKAIEVIVNLETMQRSWTADDDGFVAAKCPACAEMIEVPLDDENRTDAGEMDDLFEALRRGGIDVDAPMWLHIDRVSKLVTARQEPWRAE
jgi:hypothetical protein